MRRARLVALTAGAGLLLTAVPALAVTDPERRASPGEAEALAVLQAAARAGHDLTYSGTQYVATWRGEQAGSAVAEVRHDPASGSTVEADEPLAATAVLDPRQLGLLAARYALSVAGQGRCTGRSAHVVEAARADGSVAGRFWVDRDSGLLLRREVFDTDGSRTRSSAFLDLEVGRTAAAPVPPAPAVAPTVEDLRADGWRVPSRLPGGFRLLDTELSTPRPGRHVLHLAYSDGLSSLSLFAQPGRLGSAPMDGYRAERVGARPVWVRDQTPERVVWSGDGRVFTLVSDAPAPAVRRAVAALPRDAAPEDGLRARLGRGFARIGGLLNPFD